MTATICNQGTIVVTGASGWVGRTVLDKLTELLGATQVQQRVRAFGSHAGSLTLFNGQEVLLQALEELPLLGANKPIDFLLHCAFLTPDHYASLGHNAYESINNRITDLVANTIDQCNSAPRVVTFSSGAARLIEQQNQKPLSPAVTLYGKLKRQEELRLQSLAQTLVLRIYALTGRYIRDPRRYALGDFLHCIDQAKPIRFLSERPVIRGYGHADDIAELAIQWLLCTADLPPSRPISTVSHSIELRQLAAMICQIYNQPQPFSASFTELEPDIYTDTTLPYLDILSRYAVKVASMEDQIKDTAKAFSNHPIGSDKMLR